MNEKLQNAIGNIKKGFTVEEKTFRDESTLIISASDLVKICQSLRDDIGFNMLSSVTAVDYWPEHEAGARFHIVYQLYSLNDNVTLRLRVPVSEKNPTVPTIESLYPNANWHERELWDMFGIQIEGHSDLRRILMPYDWEGHPLRKDYPLGYEEVQFSFNAEEIDAKKPYVKE